MTPFPIFKKLALGGPTPKLKGISISPYAENLLKQVTYQKRKEYAELVVVKVGDMGLGDYPTTAQIYAWAKDNGLELCPAEVGPRLREAYTDQPEGEYLYVGMEPVLASDGDPGVFGVYRGGGGAWLDRGWARPGRHWASGGRFVFRKPSALKSSALHSEPVPLELPEELVVNGVKYRKA